MIDCEKCERPMYEKQPFCGFCNYKNYLYIEPKKREKIKLYGMTVIKISKKTGLTPDCIRDRIKKGWHYLDIITYGRYEKRKPQD